MFGSKTARKGGWGCSGIVSGGGGRLVTTSFRGVVHVNHRRVEKCCGDVVRMVLLCVGNCRGNQLTDSGRLNMLLDEICHPQTYIK